MNEGLLKNEALLKVAEEKTFREGETVFRQGEEDAHFYIVVKGVIEIVIRGADGTEKTVAYVHEGELLGEGTLFGKTHKPVTARALKELKLLSLSTENFDQFRRHDPESAHRFLLQIIDLLNHRINRSNIRMMALFEMSDMMRRNHGDLAAIARAFIGQLVGLTEAGQGLLILKNPFTEKYRTVYSTDETLDENTLLHRGVSEPHCGTDENGHFLVVNLRDFGAVGLTRGKEDAPFADKDLRLVQLIARQAASAIEDASREASEKAKTILHQKRYVL